MNLSLLMNKTKYENEVKWFCRLIELVNISTCLCNPFTFSAGYNKPKIATSKQSACCSSSVHFVLLLLLLLFVCVSALFLWHIVSHCLSHGSVHGAIERAGDRKRRRMREGGEKRGAEGKSREILSFRLSNCWHKNQLLCYQIVNWNRKS